MGSVTAANAGTQNRVRQLRQLWPGLMVWSYARKGAICRVTQSKAGSTPAGAVSN